MDGQRLKEYKINYYAAHKTKINRKKREKYQAERERSRTDENRDHHITEDTQGTHCRYDRLQKKWLTDKRIHDNSSAHENPNISSTSSKKTFATSSVSEVRLQSNEGLSADNVPSLSSNLARNIIHGRVSRGKRKAINANDLSHDDRTMVLPKVAACGHCGAYKFYKESRLLCYSGGEVVLAEIVLPLYLVHMITGLDDISKDFQNQIRTYNNTFAFTSIGMHCYETYQRRDHGIYIVKVQGQVYHFLDDLIPQDVAKRMSGIQFYFFDAEHQVDNRMSALPRLNPTIVHSLVTLMEDNPYTQFLKQASQLTNLEQYCIIIRSYPGLDQRSYNKPTCSEVAGIWLEDDNDETQNINTWDIRVHTKNWKKPYCPILLWMLRSFAVHPDASEW